MALALDRHWLKPMFRIHPTQPPPVPLHYTSVQFLSSRGAVNQVIAHSWDIDSGDIPTQLHAASIKRHIGVALLLLRNGADPNLVTLKAAL
jgi:hypothetical protein